MNSKSKHRVVENFRDFIRSSEIHQDGIEAMDKYHSGSNPGQYDIPFEFERSPEVGERSASSTMFALEKMQAIIEAGINKHKSIGSDLDNPYIERELAKSYLHLREAYLRLMDM